MLDVELQSLHVLFYCYKIRASQPRVSKHPVTANSLAWGCNRRLCLHRRWGCGVGFAPGPQAQLGRIQSHWGSASAAPEGQQHFLISGRWCICLVGKGCWQYVYHVDTFWECRTNLQFRAFRGSRKELGKGVNITLNGTKGSGFHRSTRRSDSRVEVEGDMSAGLIPRMS